jgi:hypothetical protein
MYIVYYLRRLVILLKLGCKNILLNAKVKISKWNVEEYILFRIVEAEWPQCRRCQALSYWGSGRLEWVG